MDKTLITYITNWDRVNNDVLEKEKSLHNNGFDCFVMNSSSNNNDSWINIGSNAWCYRQLFEIFKHSSSLNHDYVSILFGDIYAPNEHDISEYVAETYRYVNELPDCGVYSTSFTHDGWSYPPTELMKYNDEISYVCGVDTLYLTVNKDVSKLVTKFLKYFDKKHGIDNFKSGWAVDVLCSAISICLDKNVFRNTNSVLIHYENSGYDVGKAYDEMKTLLSESVTFWDAIGKDANRLSRTINMMFEQRTSHVYSYNDFYGVVDA